MSLSKWFVSVGRILTGFGDWMDMVEARLDSLGALREPPEETKVEPTEAVRAAVVADRAEVDEVDWLRPGGRRDQVCVRFGLSRKSVARILGGKTQHFNETHAFGHGLPANPSASQDPGSVTADPATWPVVELEEGGKANKPPEGFVREVDGLDRAIILAVRRACNAGQGDWDDLRFKIGAIRRLGTQQIAGIVARARQVGELPPNGNGSAGSNPAPAAPAPSAPVSSAPPATAASPSSKPTNGITSDPATWPQRPVEMGGQRPVRPLKPVHDVDEVDRRVTLTVFRACEAGQGDWKNLAWQIGTARRLTRQQVAGIVAVARRNGDLN